MAVDETNLATRLDALPGLSRVREAAAGTPAYLVGGAVRDLLLGRDRADLDVAVEGDVADLAASLGGEVTEHERFATAKVRADGLEIDLARTREESYPRPGALPEVRPAGIAEDLARRDFTINAMAVPLAEPELLDPHGGRDDLQRGVLRVLHERSFRDDPTRALRAARYSARFDFAPDPETEALLRDADLSTVSDDRAEAELRRLAADPGAARGFELLAGWGLIDLPDEALGLISGLDRLLARSAWQTLVRREAAVLAAARGVPDRARTLAATRPERPSAAAEAARGATPVELALARALGAEWLDAYVAEWRHVRLEIDGEDLIAAGVPEGPAVGRGLAAALARKLDGEVAGREAELAAALEAARE